MQTHEYEPEIARLLWMRVQLKQQRAQNIAQKPEIQLHSQTDGAASDRSVYKQEDAN